MPVAPPDGQYSKGTLSRSQLAKDPFAQFQSWFTHAQQNAVYQPETVCLSTASLPSGRVSARTVYLKELDKEGFVIYSNFGTSKKGKDLETNKWASLTFHWRELERQVRIEGLTERMSTEESQVYFDTRIRGSRIGAWASRQSTVVGEDDVRDRLHEVEQRFGVQSGDPYDVPLPEFWGGWRVIPQFVSLSILRFVSSPLHQRDRVLERETLSAA